ncbi:MAG: hypothetical protein FWD69_17935 [Polyangiaceae bacterium]|nr:hypothetical protein [Polyangiaceae bacterium]
MNQATTRTQERTPEDGFVFDPRTAELDPELWRIFGEVIVTKKKKLARKTVVLRPIDAVWSEFTKWIASSNLLPPSRAELETRWREWVKMEIPITTEDRAREWAERGAS